MSKIYADKIYINGQIQTVDADLSKVDAIAIKGDRFLYVGSQEEAKKYSNDATQIIDLNNAHVLPGIIESHLHVDFIGNNKVEIDGAGKTKEEILSEIKSIYEKQGEGKWIKGGGWNETNWNENSLPTKEELDKVAPNAPVYLKRYCCHSSWANSKAFEMAGILDNNVEDIIGGEILKKEDGSVLGIVTDQAQEFFLKVMPTPTTKEQEQLATLAEEEFLKYGITTIHDAGSTAEIIDLWGDMYKKEKLKVRIYAMLRVGGRPKYDELLATARDYFKRGLEIGKFNNHLTVRSFKVSLDGSLGARSAWMIDDYSDRPGHKGNGKLTDEELYNIMLEAKANGFQMVLHCIGDACNKQALDVSERVFEELPDENHRFRIEHSQILRKEDVNRFAQMKIIPSCQAITICADMDSAEERVGKERIKTSYAWRMLKDSGCKIMPISTDAPVDPLNPFYNLYAAVSRKKLNGTPIEGWYKEQAFTREEALLGVTIMGASAGFEENIKGSIEKGKLADFIIVSDDFLSCEEEKIKDIKVLETFIGGESVYKNNLC